MRNKLKKRLIKFILCLVSMDSGDFIKPKKPAPPRDGGHLLFAIKSSVSEALSDSSIHGFPGMVR